MFNTKYVGIDIGSGYTKLFYKGELIEISTPEGAVQKGLICEKRKLVEAIKPIIHQKKLKGKQGIISYNGSSVFTKAVKIPKMTPKELDNYLKLEAGSLVPFPAQEGVIDYIELTNNSTDKEMEILVIAIKNDLLIPYIEGVKEAGLTPKAIDIPALAVGRVLLKEQVQGIQVIMDIGKTSTDIHIYNNSIFRFSRSVNIGGNDFDSVLAASIGIDKEQALRERLAESYDPKIFQGILIDLQRELVRSIDYFRYRFGNQNAEFQSVYLIGENSSIKELEKMAQETTGIVPIIPKNSKEILAKGLQMWREKP